MIDDNGNTEAIRIDEFYRTEATAIVLTVTKHLTTSSHRDFPRPHHSTRYAR